MDRNRRGTLDPGSVRPRKNGRPICSGCGRPAPGYDRSATARRFEFVPEWEIAVFFVYRMRRVECPDCGVKVEQVPRGDGKNQLTRTYRWFLAAWAKRLSWREPAAARLKRRENLTEKQTVKLSELLQYNLKSVRAYLQKSPTRAKARA